MKISYFLALDFQIALQSATQIFKFKFEFSEYRLERVKLVGACHGKKVLTRLMIFLPKLKTFCFNLGS